MAQPADIRLLQLRRMLTLDAVPSGRAAAAAAIAANAGRFADAILHEAADSDDVTSPETALQYLDARLDFFAGLIDERTAGAIRAAFGSRVEAWR